jgi:PAS domain S-box-containing protein
MSWRPRIALSPIVSYLMRSLALGTVYSAAALLGLHYASIGQSVSLVWPPSGIAIAALTLMGYRYWPAILVGAFLANAATPVPLPAAAGIAVGNLSEALLAAFLLRRTAGSRPELDDFRHIRALVLLAAPAGALCSALIGCTSLWLTGVLPGTALPRVVAVWWTGDLLGAIVLAPVFFSWAVPAQAADHTRRLMEVVLLCVGTAIAAELGLSRFVAGAILSEVNYAYLLFPFVIWAALRFGARGASLMTLTVAVLAVLRTVQGGSPFVSGTSVKTLFALACYLAVVAVTALALAAAVRWEREQATWALAQSEERLRRALDAARMGTWIWSMDNNTLSWDDNLRRLYAVAPADRITTYDDFIIRVHPDDRAFVGNMVRKALQDGGDLDYEFRIVLPDGRIRWIADQGELQRDADGRPTFLAGICADVTERRSAEERLRQAHRMESVGRLAGGVAHEANNQMSVVLGAASFILRRTDVPEAVRADVEFMQKAAERTAAVTAQLLAFSRRQVLRPEVIDLNALLKRWEPVLRRIMGEDVVVQIQPGSEAQLVRADPGQIEQVLLNLALNARDAMPRGGRITVETFRTELTKEYARNKPGTSLQPGPYVVLAISDTGHGMDKQTMEHIFEPFFTTKGVGKGTGLGLSTVYGIVKQSDGYVWAYSEPGLGTTFKIYLPLRTGAVSPAKPDTTPSAVVSGETVLLVEDESSVGYMMKRALEEAGYCVIEARSATEALALAGQASGRISLLLTDVVMPGKTGRDLADEVERLIPGIPVLFTSGYTDGEIESRGLLAPGAALVPKPLTPRALVRAVQQRLGVVSRRSGENGGAAS